MNEGDHQVAEFYQRELAQALNEQAFGISRSEIIHSNESEAEATITLLEGSSINIVLLSAGYKVWRQWSRPSSRFIYLGILGIKPRSILRDFG
jgi:hypothetical protein